LRRTPQASRPYCANRFSWNSPQTDRLRAYSCRRSRPGMIGAPGPIAIAYSCAKCWRWRLEINRHSTPSPRLDRLGHVEGLAAAGNAEQHLRRLAVGDARDQLGDRVRLVADGLVFGDALERPPSDFSSRAGLCGTNEAEVSGSASPRRTTSWAMRWLWGFATCSAMGVS
jgi:hypothetical protein